MVGQHGLDLAVGITKSHFGDIVAKVCSCLLRRGSLSLQEIVRSTGLSQSEVKNCLLVLIQHNCVQAFSITKSAGFGAVPKAITQYMALFDNILHRMRFSKFLLAVKEDIGVKCEYLLEGLLQHGRLTIEQLIERASFKPAEGNTKIRDIVRETFDKLVQARYVERCPKPEPFLSSTPEDDTASTRRRGAKSTEETLTLEQQALTAAALSDAERFSGVADTVDDTMLEAKATVGEKRKHEVLEIDKETQATINENEVLWRANFEKFVQCLKKKVCVANVRARLNIDAGVVLEAMIESSDGQKDNSVKSSMDSILERLRGKEGGRLMTMQHVITFLEELGCQSRTKEATMLYTIDLKHIIDICRNDEVETLVLSRYGRDAYRIFRLLSKNQAPVETDRISDITFVDKKEAQGILYKLWMDNYLHMEKMVPSHPGQLQLFLWNVNKNSLWENVLNDMYHAALNLKQRIAYTIEQQHEVEQQLTNDIQRTKLRGMEKTRMILETSLLKLDDALMLFHDF